MYVGGRQNIRLHYIYLTLCIIYGVFCVHSIHYAYFINTFCTLQYGIYTDFRNMQTYLYVYIHYVHMQAKMDTIIKECLCEFQARCRNIFFHTFLLIFLPIIFDNLSQGSTKQFLELLLFCFSIFLQVPGDRSLCSCSLMIAQKLKSSF